MTYLEEMQETFKEVRGRIYRNGWLYERTKERQQQSAKEKEREAAAERVSRWKKNNAEYRAEVILRRRMRVIGKIDALMGIEPTEPRRPTVAEILQDVSIKHGIPIAEIKSSRRTRPLVLARHEAMWRACTETVHSLPVIGRLMGGRDHTTVIHGRNQHAKRMADGTAAGEAK